MDANRTETKQQIVDEETDERESEIEEEDEGEVEGWDDWDAEDGDSDHDDCLCLFCDLWFSSGRELFEHCGSEHSFDFVGIRKELGLDFYGSFKLVNFVRVQVAKNQCWSCGVSFECRKDLLEHLHAEFNFDKKGKFVWEDDMYLKPFMQNDQLLQCFANDEFDDEEVINAPVEQEELVDLMNLDISDFDNNNDNISDCASSSLHSSLENGINEAVKDVLRTAGTKENLRQLHDMQNDKQLRVSLSEIAATQLKNVNEYYFGAYGRYGIHREMISDQVRMDAYREAILKNPSLMNQATVMDVGCGTGILSLFAVQAGAFKVFAIEASEKMSGVAKKIVKENGFSPDVNGRKSGAIEVVHGMVEDLEKLICIPPHSVDVLVSEWMGYCLLYETMLSSVLYARDRWLKPGGAILPDTATIFAAGFAKGGTSTSFWDDVYGFDMSCIGKEILEDAARVPIVDVVDSNDILTDAAPVHTFDLATMKSEEVDFTASFELQLKSSTSVKNDSFEKSDVTQCYGIVLWFDTGFTNRFCKENEAVLSTSPYSQKTHWCQTILTFHEPILLASSAHQSDGSAVVGTEACPVIRISCRLSIARGMAFRTIDISLETIGISADGRNRRFPVQSFHL